MNRDFLPGWSSSGQPQWLLGCALAWEERLGRTRALSVAQVLDEQQRLVNVAGCGGHMRRRYACSTLRVLRSCNLLPNVRRPIAGDSSVLRLVVSVANFWGSSLIACLDRPSRRSRRLWSLGHWSPWRLVAANRVRLSRCLDEGIAFWSAPALATQCIALSTRPMGCGLASGRRAD